MEDEDMKKAELKKLMKPVMDKSEYYSRIDIPYTKQNKQKSFRKQYENGDGKELRSHFWNSISSSRIAFDLYTCLAVEQDIEDFEVEYALPGIKSGKRKPNMDIFYIQKGIVNFIESKFTESPGSDESLLPEAYYNKDDEYTSSSGRRIHKSLKERFRGDDEVAKRFSSFCYKHKEKISNHTKNDWFDYKQEICHLFGIIFYAIEIADKEMIRKIVFRNIVYKFDEYTDQFGTKAISDDALKFIKDAENMVREIFSSKALPFSFEYGYDFTQNIALQFSDKKAYGIPNLTVKELMKRYYIT